jgi:hypothetical protein
MTSTLRIEPIVGNWYESHGRLFEVVALDEGDGVIEIQHADGDLEELETEDWAARSLAGSMQPAEPPEDARLAEDHDDEDPAHFPSANRDGLQLRSDGGLDDLDLFSAVD